MKPPTLSQPPTTTITSEKPVDLYRREPGEAEGTVWGGGVVDTDEAIIKHKKNLFNLKGSLQECTDYRHGI